jgi:hypothetical protein
MADVVILMLFPMPGTGLPTIGIPIFRPDTTTMIHGPMLKDLLTGDHLYPHAGWPGEVVAGEVVLPQQRKLIPDPHALQPEELRLHRVPGEPMAHPAESYEEI